MKKVFTVCLAAMLLFSCAACAAALSKDSLLVQDLYNYIGSYLSFEGIETNSDGFQYRKFSGNSDQYDAIERYVNTLVSGGYNFKLVDRYFEDYGRDKFFSYALDYTGSGKVLNRNEMNFVDGVMGHLTIYGTIDGTRMKGYIHIGKGLQFDDLGLRADGSKVSTDALGTSSELEVKNGVYSMDGGRLSVSLGKAAVSRDGKVYETDASLVRNKTKNREELRIENYYRKESILLTVPYNSVMTGDTFSRRQIGINKDGGYDKYMDSMKDFLGWTFSNQILGVNHAGDYLVCYQDDYNDFDDVSVRVMDWDAKKGTAVFYICMTFDTEPYEVEALAAVRMGNEPVGEDADGVMEISVGEKKKLDSGLSEFGASYNIYKWEVVSGGSLIHLSQDVSKTCAIEARKEGTARVRVTYEYGAKGRNVLTGREQTDHKSKTKEFVIVISD